ncbi:MAG: phosphatase [Clostridia bacterium]|nr:phosphatase [Clostridia bacterium]
MQRNAESNLISAVRKAYYKDWRAKNKDKVKQHNLNFWNKKALQSQVVDDTENK